MPNPWKHPKTGIYYLRLRVPEDVQSYLGKKEYKVLLKTKDLGEAKVRFAGWHAETLARWAKLNRSDTSNFSMDVVDAATAPGGAQ